MIYSYLLYIITIQLFNTTLVSSLNVPTIPADLVFTVSKETDLAITVHSHNAVNNLNYIIMAKELIKEILSAADTKEALHTTFALMVNEIKEDIASNS